MHNVRNLTRGYFGFFGSMNKFALSPFTGVYEAIRGCTSPHAIDVNHTGSFGAGLGTFILSPVLLPLTAVTASIALVLSVAAVVTMPFTYTVAATMDCIAGTAPSYSR